jgi:uncharacterized membrane protein YuzA (DUF378 family)
MDITAQLAAAIAAGAGLVLGVAGTVALIFYAVAGLAGLYRDVSHF